MRAVYLEEILKVGDQLEYVHVEKYVGGLISFASTVIFLFTLDISG